MVIEPLIAVLVLALYLLKEAAENRREERWTAFWIDIAFMVPCLGILAMYMPGVFSAVLEWLA